MSRTLHVLYVCYTGRCPVFAKSVFIKREITAAVSLFFGHFEKREPRAFALYLPIYAGPGSRWNQDCLYRKSIGVYGHIVDCELKSIGVYGHIVDCDRLRVEINWGLRTHSRLRVEINWGLRTHSRLRVEINWGLRTHSRLRHPVYDRKKWGDRNRGEPITDAISLSPLQDCLLIQPTLTHNGDLTTSPHLANLIEPVCGDVRGGRTPHVAACLGVEPLEWANVYAFTFFGLFCINSLLIIAMFREFTSHQHVNSGPQLGLHDLTRFRALQEWANFTSHQHVNSGPQLGLHDLTRFRALQEWANKVFFPTLHFNRYTQLHFTTRVAMNHRCRLVSDETDCHSSPPVRSPSATFVIPTNLPTHIRSATRPCRTRPAILEEAAWTPTS
ncbi:hypothetical protein J6590_057396 [Homalodisca vitripennis]|nr:hypothetical protein J6590_057396 [Homalodisca vitripennis]